MLAVTAAAASAEPATQPATKPGGDPIAALEPTPPDWPRWIAAAYDPHRQWPAVRYLSFDFVSQDAEGNQRGRFRHLWDRTSGEYRYECDGEEFASALFLDEASGSWKPLGVKLPSGRLVALMNRKTGTGRVLVGGQPQSEAIVRRVFERIANDTFWLLLPLEPGAGARFQQIGPKQLVDGTPAIHVRLTYESEARPGATAPASQPAPAVAPTLARAVLWDLYLFPGHNEIIRTEATAPGSGKALAADWFGHTHVRDIVFSTERRLANHTLRMDAISLPRGVPPGVFTDAAVRMPVPVPAQTQPGEE